MWVFFLRYSDGQNSFKGIDQALIFAQKEIYFGFFTPAKILVFNVFSSGGMAQE